MATILALMLIVAFIANYVANELPAQMAEAELDHELEVQNELGFLQAEIQALVEKPNPQIQLTAPIDLSAPGVPPFGLASSGTLRVGGMGSSDSLTYGSAIYGYDLPGPSTGNLCSIGTCTSTSGGVSASLSSSGDCAPAVTYNFAGSNRTWSLSLSGSDDCFAFTFVGDHDVISVTESGSSDDNQSFTVVGNDDFVNVVVSGSHEAASFAIVGGNDAYNETRSGTDSYTDITFAGESFPPRACPGGNESGSDVYQGSVSGRDDTQNVTWVNSAGYVTSPHTITTTGGRRWHRTTLGVWTFVNQSVASEVCPFVTVTPAYHTETFGASVRVLLANQYVPPATVAYSQGGVVLGHDSESSVMEQPPDWSFTIAPSDVNASVTLVQFVGQPVQIGGLGAAGLTIRVESMSRVFLPSDASAAPYGLAGPILLNLTTALPGAWVDYLDGLGGIATDVTCRPLGVVGPGFGCEEPPQGTSVEVTAELHVNELTLTEITLRLGADPG